MMIKITAADGHRLDAYIARPTGNVQGGLVIAQEMYGLTDYLKATCEFYASRGFLTIAPALYDRMQSDLVLPYDRANHDRAQAIYKNWNWDTALDDLDAGKAVVSEAGKVGLVGFCWGGTLAWLAACRRNYDAAIAYYGSMMPDFANEQARCPVIAIIGSEDGTLRPQRIEQFRQAQPEIPVHIYEGARHGFDNESRVDRYHEHACREARALTVSFLNQHL